MTVSSTIRPHRREPAKRKAYLRKAPRLYTVPALVSDAVFRFVRSIQSHPGRRFGVFWLDGAVRILDVERSFFKKYMASDPEALVGFYDRRADLRCLMDDIESFIEGSSDGQSVECG